MKKKKSDQLISQVEQQIEQIRERNVFKLLPMFGYILGVKLCTLYVLDNPSSPQRYARPHYSFRYNIVSKNITRICSFKAHKYFYINQKTQGVFSI